MNTAILYIIRLIFLALTSFESLNLFGFLNFALEYSWLGLVLTALAVWLGLEFVNHFVKTRYNYSLPAFIFVIPTLNVLVDAFGDIFRWYGKFFWYDQLGHFLGGAAAAGIVFFITLSITRYKNLKISKFFLGLFAFSLANVFGILYELEEYAESFFLHNNRLGDRFDTPNDLFFNLVGSLICVLVIVLTQRAKKGKNY